MEAKAISPLPPPITAGAVVFAGTGEGLGVSFGGSIRVAVAVIAGCVPVAVNVLASTGANVEVGKWANVGDAAEVEVGLIIRDYRP